MAGGPGKPRDGLKGLVAQARAKLPTIIDSGRAGLPTAYRSQADGARPQQRQLTSAAIVYTLGAGVLFVMAISILVFSLVPSTAHFAVKFGARVVLLPLIAGLAYEVIRFSARHLDSKVCRALITPGLWLQKITTKEPDDKQLEIAIVALKEALMYDAVEDGKQAAVA